MIRNLKVNYRIITYILIIFILINIFNILTLNNYRIYRLNKEYNKVVLDTINKPSDIEYLYIENTRNDIVKFVSLLSLNDDVKSFIIYKIEETVVTTSDKFKSDIRAFYIDANSYQNMGIYKYIYNHRRIKPHIHIYKCTFQDKDYQDVILHEYSHMIDNEIFNSKSLDFSEYIDYSPDILKFILLCRLKPSYNINDNLYYILIKNSHYFTSNSEIFARAMVILYKMKSNGYSISYNGLMNMYINSNNTTIDDLVFLLFFESRKINNFIEYLEIDYIF